MKRFLTVILTTLMMFSSFCYCNNNIYSENEEIVEEEIETIEEHDNVVDEIEENNIIQEDNEINQIQEEVKEKRRVSLSPSKGTNYSITCTQDENTKDIIIEGDPDFLSEVVKKQISYVNGTRENGGHININSSTNNYYITNIEYYYSYYDVNEPVCYKVDNYHLNDEGDKIIIPFDTIKRYNIPSGEYSISMQDSAYDNYASSTMDIDGCKEITNQPTITELANGDIRIDCEDKEYLQGLVHIYNYLERYTGSFGGVFCIQKQGSDVGGDAFNYNYYKGQRKLFTLVEDGNNSYVLLSKEKIEHFYYGTIVNGTRNVVLNSYGYVPTAPISVTFTKHYIAAPNDVETELNGNVLKITSNNTEWLKQTQYVVLVNKTNDDWRSYYNNQCMNEIGKTLYYNMSDFSIEAGTYEVFCCSDGQCYSFKEDEEIKYYSNECNKDLGEFTFNNISGNNTNLYNRFSSEIENDNLVLTFDDSSLFNMISCTNTETYTKQEMVENANSTRYSFLNNDYIYIVSNNPNISAIIKTTDQGVVLGNNKINIPLNLIKTAGLTLYKNSSYTVYTSIANTYNLSEGFYSNDYGSQLKTPPNSISISENLDGDITIEIQNNDYLNSIYGFELSDTTNNVYSYSFDISNLGSAVIAGNTITVPSEDLCLANGEYDFYICAHGFDYYTKESAIEIKHSSLKECPDFNVYFDQNNDLIITSQDSDFLNALCQDDDYYKFSAIEYEKIINKYSIESRNSILINMAATNVGNGAVKFECHGYGYCDGMYKYQLKPKGYKVSETKNINVSGFSQAIPSDLTISIENKKLYIYSNNIDYLEKLNTVYNVSKSYVRNQYYNDSSIYWPSTSSYGGGGAGYEEITLQAVQDLDNNRVYFDLTDISDMLAGDDYYEMYVWTRSSYEGCTIPLNTSVYEIKYHNDQDYTDDNLEYVHYYTKGVEVYNYPLKDIDIDGYKFYGWYSDSTLNNKITSIDLATKNSDIDVYAKLFELYTINYHLDGGTNGNNPVEYTAADAFSLKRPSKSKYEFEGWYTNSSFTGNKVYSIQVGTTGNIDLYAKWTATTETETEEFSELVPTVVDISSKLSEIIQLNIYFEFIDDECLDDAYANYIFNGEEHNVLLSTLSKDNDNYVLNIDLNCKQLNEPIEIWGSVEDKQSEHITTSINDYLTRLKAQYPNNTSLKELVDALADYCTYAKYYFDGTTNVNPITNTIDFEVFDYKINSLGSKNSEKLTKASLVLNSTVSIRIYKRVNENYNMQGKTLTAYKIDGNNKTTISNNRINDAGDYVEISNIKVSELLNRYQVVLKDGATTIYDIEYSPMSYGYQVFKSSTSSTNLKNLMIKMYEYGKCAKEYIED